MIRAVVVALLVGGCGRIAFDPRTDAGDASTTDANPIACGSVPVVEVAAGRHFSCARLEDGGVQCWGINYEGQLGNADLGNVAPVPVPLPGPATSIDAGAFHACAALTDGRVFCWGRNDSGQLGDGTYAKRVGPVQVTMPLADEVATGSRSSCARTRGDGRVYCWGENSRNELGDGTTVSRPTPGAVVSSGGTIALAAGHRFTCALTAAGTVSCWGWNNRGQLGDGTTAARPAPVQVTNGLANVAAITAGGQYACALREDGRALCWGSNDNGQYGTGDYVTAASPVLLPTTGIQSLSAGVRHLCVVTATGVSCSGTNYRGQLGDGTLMSRADPTRALDGSVTQVSSGYDHTCVLRDGEVTCWGNATEAELGDGVRTTSVTPSPVALPETAVDIAIGERATCATLASGAVHCWGGVPPNNTITSPAAVPLVGPERIGIGYDHICGLAGGRVGCFGLNYVGQLGTGAVAESSTPVNVLPIVSATELSAAGFSSCVSEAAGARCWGGNVEGTLGNGTQTNSNMPVGVMNVTSAPAQLAVGPRHVCARLGNGDLRCWGKNDKGQLGTGTATALETTAQAVVGIANVDEIAAGGSFSCARVGTLVSCWGRNNEAQLGNGSLVDSSVPVAIAGFAASSVAVGENHACSIAAGTGDVYCWGWNGSGQIGDGTAFTRRPTPTRVIGLEPAQKVVASNQFTCALTQTGQVRCWGVNASGQLGDGKLPHGATPRLARVYCR